MGCFTLCGRRTCRLRYRETEMLAWARPTASENEGWFFGARVFLGLRSQMPRCNPGWYGAPALGLGNGGAANVRMERAEFVIEAKAWEECEGWEL